MKKPKYRFVLQRYKEGFNQTTGVLLILDSNGWPVFSAPCIERGDRNNQKRVSNVLPGIYPIRYEYSPAFDRFCWELYGTDNRTECKIHPANFWDQLNGCIAPGGYLKDLNKDGYQDVARSVSTVNMIDKIMAGMTETTIEIIDPI